MLDRVRWRFCPRLPLTRGRECFTQKIIIVLIENFPHCCVFVFASSCITMMWWFSARFHCRLSIQSTIQWELSFPLLAMAPFKRWHSSALSFHFCFCWRLFKSDRPGRALKKLSLFKTWKFFLLRSLFARRRRCEWTTFNKDNKWLYVHRLSHSFIIFLLPPTRLFSESETINGKQLFIISCCTLFLHSCLRIEFSIE